MSTVIGVSAALLEAREVRRVHEAHVHRVSRQGHHNRLSLAALPQVVVEILHRKQAGVARAVAPKDASEVSMREQLVAKNFIRVILLRRTGMASATVTSVGLVG